MKTFKTYLSENLSDDERNKKIAYHNELANFHGEKSRFHKQQPVAHNIMQHSIASNGHSNAARDHSGAANLYKMFMDDAAKERAAMAERSSQAANNRSKSLE